MIKRMQITSNEPKYQRITQLYNLVSIWYLFREKHFCKLHVWEVKHLSPAQIYSNTVL